MRRFFSRSNLAAFRLRVGHEIKERLCELCTVHHHRHLGDEKQKNTVDHQMVTSDDHQGGDNENVYVIRIVGFEGLGNTTLANLVYNDERVVRNFELRMWQHMSVDFDTTRLAKEILCSALGTKITEGLYLDQMQEQLRDALKDKKCMLVFVVWNADRIKWSELPNLLIEGNKVGTDFGD